MFYAQKVCRLALRQHCSQRTRYGLFSPSSTYTSRLPERHLQDGIILPLIPEYFVEILSYSFFFFSL